MGVWEFSRARRRRRKKTCADSGRFKRRIGLAVEPLEQRLLFAISPTLVSIISNIPNEGDVLTNATPPLHVAPRELTIRFDPGQSIDPATLATGIHVVRSGDGVFGNGDDVDVTPVTATAKGFLGLGERSSEVIVRFDGTLADDAYQITIVGGGGGALKNTAGQAFNNGVNVTTTFRLDLGPQVTAVVPQPITRTPQGQLQQANNQIVVYFNNDRLNTASAQDTDLYQLIFTASSATTADDVVFHPTSVIYSPGTNSALLTFAGPLNALGGPGTYRLRIGDNATAAGTSIVDVSGDVAGSSFATATELGALTTQSKVLTGGAIDPPGSSATNLPYLLNLPGGIDEPGHRDIPAEGHLGGADGTAGITTYEYNFRSVYGSDPQGNTLFNQITEVQKQRVREIFEMYGYYLGVKFIETPDSGLTIATGDLRAVSPTVPTGPGGVAGIAGGGLAVMDNAENWGNSEFGGGYFQTAMHEIGHLLGLGHTYDLPPLTIMGSEGELAPGGAEGVFPGDNDIAHGQHLYRPESKDIDLYRFTLNTAGRFSAETIAERLASPSLADTVLTLYDSSGNVVARNDDYFSSDSFLDLTLAAGTYFVVVTSTGNVNFNPNVADSGFGGTSEGPYTLRLNFSPATPAKQLSDTTGTALDGDFDGVPGGQFNFWFKVTDTTNAPGDRTIYVDKVAPTAGADGTLAHPYNRIQVALANAVAGDTVRIVGNGGADNNLATVGDNRAYEIGFDIFASPLSDGATIDLPKGVTMMIDAGAIIKLRAANINAGSFSQGIDLSGSAIQVLGTPQQSVFLTSYNNESVGVDTSPLVTTPQPGDWGGLVFRDDSDHEAQGIFLNYVAHADISYGGGSGVVNSVSQVFDPIHMVTARPAILYNNIHDNADAAMSADPDSFEETLFRDDSFTADYRRVGPLIHGNAIARDSINGLFVRIRTVAGVPIDVMRVSGRFDDTDIVHVITENLLINGTPGGPQVVGNVEQARLDARLAVDPGIVVKLKGSRIEAGISSQLIAEGRAGSDVVFTSLLDDRYGAGGVFDTTGDAATSIPLPGDWAGLDFDPASKGSIDHAVITFGGGGSPIEGQFTTFNAVEIRQADVRLTNSVIARNAQGFAPDDRNGRGTNAAAAVFVRGAQPIIVNNIFRSNAGDAININADSLNALAVIDYGRSTGTANSFNQFNDNFGPLVRLNVLSNNDINGMAVRGATLTTASVWDDTDIVHVLRNEIVVPDFHTSQGTLRLQSSPTASLVIKLFGAQAGFTASGRPLDIDDRIGGSLQVLGTPGHQVIMTSLADSTVGAGFDLDGKAQVNTLGNGLPSVTTPSKMRIQFEFGPGLASNPAAQKALELAAQAWESVLDDPITVTIDIDTGSLEESFLGVANSVLAAFDYNDVRQKMIADAGSSESIVSKLPTFAQLNTTFPDASYTTNKNIVLNRANALALGYKAAQLPTQVSVVDGVTPVDATITFNTNFTFDYDRSDGLTGADFLAVAIHEIGHALGFVSAVDAVDTGITKDVPLTPLDLFRLAPGAGTADFTDAPRNLSPGTPGVFFDGGQFDRANLALGTFSQGDIPLSTGKTLGDGNQASHWKYRGLLDSPTPIGIMDPIIFDFGTITQADVRAFDLIGYNAVNRGSPDDWRSLRLAPYSNDRNVDVVQELEPAYTGSSDANNFATKGQFVGTLAADDKNGDENRRLGFEIHGNIAFDRSGDVDIYSFNAVAGTQVWFDIDKTDPSLDSIVELVGGNGVVLARSDNSPDETANPSLLVGSATVAPRELQATDFSGDDLFTTNPKDAGMRLVLPGPVGTTNTYYVRVRSRSGDLTNLTAGQTSGRYQLQIRLGETDEIPGSTIQYADVRYTHNGIEVLGLPSHSPLVGEASRALPISNTTSAAAQDLGNLLDTDRNAIDVSSALVSATDVDWYKFTIDYQSIQSIGGFSDAGKTWATVFDIDFADGVSRPDLTLSIWDATADDAGNAVPGKLIFVSRDSNVTDDQPAPLDASSSADLTRESFGKLDPFLGSIQLPEGEKRTYFVAISSNATLPKVLDATFVNDATNKLIRLEPVDGVKRIVEDHIGSIGYTTSDGKTKILPTTPAILPIADQFVANPNPNFPNTKVQKLSTNIVPYTLADLQLFVAQDGVSSGVFTQSLKTVNPATGKVNATIGGLFTPGTGDGIDDIVIRSDGLMMGTQTRFELDDPDGTADRLVAIDPTDATIFPVGNDAIPDAPDPPPVGSPPPRDALSSSRVDALTYRRFDPGNPLAGISGAIFEPYELFYAVRGSTMSFLYEASPIDGHANATSNNSFTGPVGGAATSFQSYAGIYQTTKGDMGITTGMAYVTARGVILNVPIPSAILDGQFFSVSDAAGAVTFEFDTGGGVQQGRRAVDLTTLPPNATANDVANAVVAAINAAASAGVLAVSASISGSPTLSNQIVVSNAFGASAGNSLVIVSSLANGTQLWGVSNTGKLFTIRDSRPFSVNQDGSVLLETPGDDPTKGLATFVRDFGPSVSFAGLALGPQNLDLNGDGLGGDLATTLFAITTNGDLYAIDPATGTFRMDVFKDAQGAPIDHISTGLQGVTGLAFSPLDFNLWHPTTQDGNDAGHGTTAAPDNSRDKLDPGDPDATPPRPPEASGGKSFYFGYENLNGGYLSYAQGSQFGFGNAGTQFGELSRDQQLDLTRNAMRLAANIQTGLAVPFSTNFAGSATMRQNALIGNNYNLPGGARGSLVTDAFSLEGYDYTDKPTLYFDYLAEGGATLTVFASTDDGTSWLPLATAGGKLPKVISVSSNIGSDDENQRVQPLFKNVKGENGVLDTTWRQARVDIGDFAGFGNVKLRFEFKSGTSGNNFKGWMIDDIMVGLAERGEMVTGLVSATGTAADTSYFEVPKGTDPGGSSQVLVGPYQLEIRRGEEYGFSLSGLDSRIDILGQADTNDRLLKGVTLLVPGGSAMFVPAATALAEGQTFSIGTGPNARTFEFDAGNGVSVAGRIGIPLIAAEDSLAVARRVLLAINNQTSDTFQVAASLSTDFNGTQLYLSGAPAVDTSGTPALSYFQEIFDGETFVLDDSVHRVTFEFDDDGNTSTGNIPVPFSPSDTPAQVAAVIRAVINALHGPGFSISAAGSPTNNRVDLFGTARAEDSSTFALLAERFDFFGDQNLPRAQGEIVLKGNRIQSAANFGIVVDAAARDANGAHPGAARNLREINTPRLVPGVVIENNVIDSALTGGILFSGDPNGAGLYNAVVPFGRIINNTIYGNGKGVGIQVTDNASPTILNNILASLQTGVSVDGTSNTTVVGATLYQGNSVNSAGIGLGPFAIVPPANAPLFVNAAAHNFNLLKTNSTGLINQAIDSSLDSLQDRQAMITIDQPLGIGPSQILAPETDLTGKLRADDPSVNPSIPGLGSNPFKDRGALDSSDFIGPVAVLVHPADNDAGGVDQDPTFNSVVEAPALADFQLQLNDGNGAGVDDATVSGARFTLTRDGAPLVDGIDYVFGYDATNKIARFTPVVGIWTVNHVYTIAVDNSAATGIRDLAANRLQPNELSGQTRFTIALLPLDFGDAPDPYPTLVSNNGARHVLSNGLFLGAGASADANGQPTSDAAADNLDDGVVFNTALLSGTTATITVTASQAGMLDAWIDYDRNGSWSDGGEQIFASQALVAGPNVLTFQVPATTITSTFARFRVSTAGGLAPTGLATDGEVEDYRVDIAPVVSYSIVLVNPTTGKELLKDADGNYLVLGGTAFRVQVYVDDLRDTGAAGGVFSAFADLTRDSSFITWSGLAISANFPNVQNGTIDAGQQIVDEAGGIGSIGPAGADPKQLLFSVDGNVDLTAPLGTRMTLSLDAADVPLSHDTLVYGLGAPVSAIYGSAPLIVPVNAWNNPVNSMDVDGDGDVLPLDALWIINKLNARFGGPNGELATPPIPPTIPAPYVDVVPDGFLTGLDALVIINFLNTQAQAQLAGGGASAAAVMPPQQAPLVVDAGPPQPSITVSAAATDRSQMTGPVQESSTPLVSAKDAVFAGTDLLPSVADAMPWMPASVAQASVAAQTTGGTAYKPLRTAAADERKGAVDQLAAGLFARHAEDASAMDLEDVDPRLAHAWSGLAPRGRRPR